VTIAEAATQEQVDRSTIMRIRMVAKEGALAALAASKPGVAARQRDYELEQARAENARLGEALKQMAVKLMLAEGEMNHPGFRAHLPSWEGWRDAEQVRQGDPGEGGPAGQGAR
jgi:hypothetical protein